MGNPGYIIIEAGGRDFPHPVCFYTHQQGRNLKFLLQRALTKGRDRWHMPSYLARIIFCNLVGLAHDWNTHYGLSTDPVEDGCCENPLLHVHMENQTVREEDGSTWFFQEFIEAPFEDNSEKPEQPAPEGNQTIEDAWKTFLAESLEDEADEEKIRSYKMAFYMGTEALLERMAAALSNTHIQVRVLMDETTAELEEYRQVHDSQF